MNAPQIQPILKITWAVIALVVASPLSAEIYKWTDENGLVHFSDTKPADQAAEQITVQDNSIPSISSYEKVSYVDTKQDVGKKVVMYSATWCGYCKQARRYFQANRIAFTEYDVEKNAKGRRDYKRLGARGVPVILVGNKRMYGFSESRFRAFYRN